MIIRELLCKDFRCHNYAHIAPEPGLNVLVGENGEGKTALLEALYVLATSKSHRSHKDVELIRFGQPIAQAVANVYREAIGGDREVGIVLSRPGAEGVGVDRKSALLDGQRLPRVAELLGHLNVVLFASTDLAIVQGDPDERRRFLDYELAQASPKYALTLGAFRRILTQRNELLRTIKHGGSGVETLDTWTDQLCDFGSKVMSKRAIFLEALGPKASAIHASLAGDRETLRIRYAPCVPIESHDTEAIRVTLRAYFDKIRVGEMVRGTSLSGPQRDDIEFLMTTPSGDLVDVRSFGSQGQQRTAALALRLAEEELLEEWVGESPIILLDDVLSDLDVLRRSRIFTRSRAGAQTFITTTDLSALPKSMLVDAKVWRVTPGGVEESGVHTNIE